MIMDNFSFDMICSILLLAFHQVSLSFVQFCCWLSIEFLYQFTVFSYIYIVHNVPIHTVEFVFDGKIVSLVTVWVWPECTNVVTTALTCGNV